MTTRATRSPRRRTVIALAVVLAVLAAFVVRLVDIQVVNAREHIDDSLELGLAEKRTLYGTRGSIVDATGAVLAGSSLQYDCQLDPQLIAQVDADIAAGTSSLAPWSEISAKMAAIVGQTPEQVQQIVADELAVNPESQFAYLQRGLSTEQYRAIADLDVPYDACTQHPARTYPDGAVAGNLIGFTGSDGEPLAGLEQIEDSCLAATNGTLAYQKGKDGVVIPGTETTLPAVDGGTLTLTINRDLEWYLQQLIAEEVQNKQAQSGQIFVLEVGTGKIRAAAEYPTVDPNDVDASDAADRGTRLFINSFEPGSTFKAITAASLIDAGVANPLSTVTASGRETFPNGAVVGDSFGHPATNYTLTGALIDSSNVAMSKFGELLSADARHDYLARFGVGAGTAVGWPSEAQGVLHPTAEWDNQSLYATNFGQAFTVTVPQVASAYQAIANGGLQMPLSLVESCTRADGTVTTPDLPEPQQVVKESTADQVSQMLENVAVQGGLAKSIAVPGYRIATKTGTAQKTDGNGNYKGGLYFTSLIGFAPADDPQYVVMVTLDEPTTVRSSAANATAFQKAMTQVMKTYRVMPSDSQTTLLPKTQ